MGNPVVAEQFGTEPGKIIIEIPLGGNNPNRCIQTRLWSSLSGKEYRGQWSLQESNLHINILELKAVYLAILTFYKMIPLKHIHCQRD